MTWGPLLQSALALRGFPRKPGPESLVFLWLAQVLCCEDRRSEAPTLAGDCWCRAQAHSPLLLGDRGQGGRKQRTCSMLLVK